MRKRFFILSTLLIVFTLLFTSKSYAATPLYPVNNIYTEGIYKIPKSVSDAGIITNKDTLIIITEDQVSLYFNKV